MLRRRRIEAALLLHLILISSWLLRATYLWSQPLAYDEAMELLFARLVRQGHQPYTEIFIGIPPLGLWLVQLGDMLTSNLLATRFPMMTVALIGLGGLFLCCQPSRDRWHLLWAGSATLLLSMDTLYFLRGVSLDLEVAALALALLAMALAIQFTHQPRRRWLLLSGLSCAASLLIKPLLVFLPPLVLGMLITTRRLTRPQFIRRSGLWLLGLLLPWLLVSLIYGPQNLYQQIFAFRFAVSEYHQIARDATRAGNLLTILHYLYLNGNGLYLGAALLGMILAWHHHRPTLALWSGWLLLSIALLIWHMPLRYRYLVILTPPLALFNGFLLMVGSRALYRHRPHPTTSIALSGMLSLWVVGLSWPVLQQLHAAKPLPHDTAGLFDYAVYEHDEIIRDIQQHSLPTDCLITDDARIALRANRLPPPWLSEFSWARLRTNWLLSEIKLLKLVNLHDCPVVYLSRRIHRAWPTIVEKLHTRYFLKIVYNEQLSLLLIPKELSTSPPEIRSAQFGDYISLQGFHMAPPTPAALQLALYWITPQRPPQNYKLFLQLRHLTTDTLLTFDQYPYPAPTHRYQFQPQQPGQFNLIPTMELSGLSPTLLLDYPQRGMLPTAAWPLETPLRQPLHLPLPPTLDPGPYALDLGWYDSETMRRLPVTISPEQPLQQSLRLTTFTLPPPQEKLP